MVFAEHGFSIGNFVFDDDAQLRFVERVTAKGDPAQFQELLEGSLLAMGYTVLSSVYAGVWEVSQQKQPQKLLHYRNLNPGSTRWTDNPITPATSIVEIFEASGVEEEEKLLYVLPHFGYD